MSAISWIVILLFKSQRRLVSENACQRLQVEALKSPRGKSLAPDQMGQICLHPSLSFGSVCRQEQQSLVNMQENELVRGSELKTECLNQFYYFPDRIIDCKRSRHDRPFR